MPVRTNILYRIINDVEGCHYSGAALCGCKHGPCIHSGGKTRRRAAAGTLATVYTLSVCTCSHTALSAHTQVYGEGVPTDNAKRLFDEIQSSEDKDFSKFRLALCFAWRA